MILDKFSLSGKVALVTGARRGLGRAMAQALAEVGADLFLVDTAACTECQSAIVALGRRCEVISADLSANRAAASAVKECVARMGHVDVVVNNAGIIRRAPLLEFSEQDWDDVINVNLRAVFFLSQAAACAMADRGAGGRIINIASMLSFQGGILVPSYTASKSAVLGLTRSMANELAPHRITVNAIAPGYMATDNTAALRADPDRAQAILSRIPAGRWGEPQDLQGAVVFLASDAASYVTGSVIAVDGGWLVR